MTERRHPCRRIAAILPAFEIDRQDAGAPQARCLRSKAAKLLRLPKRVPDVRFQ